MASKMMFQKGDEVVHRTQGKRGKVDVFHAIKRKYHVLWENGRSTWCRPTNLIHKRDFVKEQIVNDEQQQV